MGFFSLSINELTAWFHEFSEYDSTNFVTNISQLKKGTNSLLVKKGILFLTFEQTKINSIT